MKLRILIAQLNLLVGDVAGNLDKVLAAARAARDEQGADLVVFPELTLTGYPPEDLLLRPELIRRCEAALARVCTEVQRSHPGPGLPQGRARGAVQRRRGDP